MMNVDVLLATWTWQEFSMELKRKIYGTLLQWKEQSRGRMALMVDVARRVGKSHIVELFVESSTWATRDCWSRTPLGTMVSRRIPSTDQS